MYKKQVTTISKYQLHEHGYTQSRTVPCATIFPSEKRFTKNQHCIHQLSKSTTT